MIPADPHPLDVGDGPLALGLAMDEPDPDSLSAATRLRRRVSPDLAALALEQASLRRRARVKFGEQAGRHLYTATGLEQATRPQVSAWRAQTFGAEQHRGSGEQSGPPTRVVDLGCGLGFDALAFAAAGHEVDAVERDPLTASCARHNLAQHQLAHSTPHTSEPAAARVWVGDAEQAVDTLLDGRPEALVFVDPARRSTTGRSWRLEDLSPGWDFVLGLRSRAARLVVKLGPGIARSALPDDLDRHWVSHDGSLVELCLASVDDPYDTHSDAPSDAGSGAGVDHVVALRGDRRHTLVSQGLPRPQVGPIGSYLHEPDPAVIRAQVYAELVASLAGAEAWFVDHDVAYLTSDAPLESPLLASFAVGEVLPWSEKTVRAWCRAHDVGTLEIKKRGIDVDPAELRRRLKLRGRAAATLVITPTPAGARAVFCRRLPA
ncbi:THUMP-like domain-containing protein [Aestuariimicrobium soli]|uniref:THUMP-like domain-containing protein n=1 Tax=Aestuariimicrobium soli TaxID=2035834 RepID=UPI003EBF7F1B